jgi:hypothetical protein
MESDLLSKFREAKTALQLFSNVKSLILCKMVNKIHKIMVKRAQELSNGRS